MTAWGTETRSNEDRPGSWRAVILCVLAAIVAVVAVVITFLPAGWIEPIDVVHLAVGSAALIATGALGVAILRIRGVVAGFAAALVVAAATVVSISYVLSLFDQYNRTALIAANLLALGFMFGLWRFRGRPHPLIRLPSLGELREEAGSHPYLTAIVVALGFATGVEAVLALGVAPNNYDSMFYHLSRIGYWMQNDSVFPFEGGTVFQLQHPPNAEILQAWTMELSQGDRFAQFIQWLALVGLVCVIYAGSRFIGFSRAGSLFAAAIFGTLPSPVLEASSTQNDVVAAFFVCAAALFLVRAVAGARPGDAIVGALALGLAIGTKGAVLFALPGLALLGAAALWQWRPPGRFVAVWSMFLVVAVLVLGSPPYVRTTLDTGSPLGDTASVKRRTEPIPESAGKTLWGLVDLPGRNAVPPVGNLLADGEDAVWGDYPGSSPDMDVHEDFTGFGPIGLLVVFPLLGLTAIRRRGPPDRRLLAVASLSYVVLFVVFVAVQPFDMRLMIIPVALGAPLLACVADVPWLRRSTVLVAVVCLMPVLFANQQKPLLPGNFALGMGPAQQRAGSNLGFEEMLRNTENAIRDDQRIGYVGTSIDWDYPLFGPRFDRFVVRLWSLETPADVRAAMEDHDLDSIVWGVDPPRAVHPTLVNESDPPKRGTTRWVSRVGAP